MFDEKLELPTKEDLLINEKIMGKCNHVSSEILINLSRGLEVYIYSCTCCGELFLYHAPFTAEDKHPPENYFQRNVHCYSANKISARIVQHKLQTMGWRLSFTIRNGRYTCIAKKEGQVLYSNPSNTEHKSVLDSAVEIAKTL